MTIANALKTFFLKLNGSTPAGTNIADVIRNGASSVQLNNESAQAATVSALGARVDSLEADHASFVLLSSTEDSTKKFSVTVDDSGALTATEIVAETTE